MLDTRRACAALALLLALLWPDGVQARKNVPREPGEVIQWVTPWREGLTLRYASEDDDVSIGAGGTERSRVTAIETIRITKARDDGFVQHWSFADSRYEQLEGGEEQEALMRRVLEALPDLVLEVDLDAAGNFAGLRNLDVLAAQLRPALRDGFSAMLESGIAAAAGSPGAAPDAGALGRGREFADGMVERMTRPEVLGPLMAQDAAAYNDAFGAELEAGVPFEADVEIPSPLGGGSVPARVVLLMRPGPPGSDEATLDWTTRMERGRAAEVALAAVEQMYGIDLHEEERGRIADGMTVVDTGHARFRRSTGVPLMMETLRTVEAAGEQRIERRRMRLLDDPHGHAWPDDGPPQAADSGTPPAPDQTRAR